MVTDDTLRLQIFDILSEGQDFRRAMLFDASYASLPRDPQARVQVYHYEIAPGAYTNWHLHNGATFFCVLQGEFEAHFEDGTRITAKAGDVYSEPLGKVHRGHNPRRDIANVGIGISLTSPDREPVTNVDEPLSHRDGGTTTAAIDQTLVDMLEKARIAATLSNDPDQLSPWLDEDLTYIHSSAVKDTKQSYLASLRDGHLAYRDIRCTYDSLIPLGPDTFMSTGHLDASIALDCKPVKLDNLFIAVWTRRADRRWRLLSWQSTRIPAAA